ncbi:metallophosphoesterase [Larkinella sp. GY13]|uniref:metallophosphoesterase n=1 Tax=Larkinella sp. GY13 TaxID=3453720 RepID=UPI003EED6BC3
MSINRRSFLEKASKMGALGALSPTARGAVSPADSKKNAFVTGPYLQNVGPSEATVMWVTQNNSLSWVEYGAGNSLSLKEYRYRNGHVEANNKINKITLNGLKPGTLYKYRIVSSEILDFQPAKVTYAEPIKSPVYSFKTPGLNDEEVKLVIFNDIHDRPQTIPQLLYRHGYTGNRKDFDFIVFNGDCFDNVNTEKQVFDHLLNPCVDLFAREIPFILTQGNHETRGAFSRNIPDYFAYPTENYYYAFTQGPVRFVVMDSGEDKTDDNWEYSGLAAYDAYRVKERLWLEKEIETEAFKKAPFRVILIHIPPFHSGDWHGPLHNRELFAPLFAKGKADLVISGHTHRYGVHQPDANHPYPIIIGGGPLEGNRTLMKLHANSKELTLRMIRDDGEEVGKYAVKRTKM